MLYTSFVERYGYRVAKANFFIYFMPADFLTCTTIDEILTKVMFSVQEVVAATDVATTNFAHIRFTYPLCRKKSRTTSLPKNLLIMELKRKLMDDFKSKNTLEIALCTGQFYVCLSEKKVVEEKNNEKIFCFLDVRQKLMDIECQR